MLAVFVDAERECKSQLADSICATLLSVRDRVYNIACNSACTLQSRRQGTIA